MKNILADLIRRLNLNILVKSDLIGEFLFSSNIKEIIKENIFCGHRLIIIDYFTRKKKTSLFQSAWLSTEIHLLPHIFILKITI